MLLRITCLSAFAAAAIMVAASTGAQAYVEAGGLSCTSPGAAGSGVGAVLNLNCVFVPSLGGSPQRYSATLRRIGVDLGYSQNVGLGWVVVAPTAVVGPGELAGTYGGVSAGATFGVGLGGNALIGGSNNTFALQPVSGQVQSGLNVSAGVAGLELRPMMAQYAPPLRPHVHVLRHRAKR
jgi:hypothetical protein